MHLHDEIAQHFRLTKTQKAALKKLQLHTISDLLYHFPHRYEDIASAVNIADITPNEMVTVYAELTNLEKTLSWKTRKYVTEATLIDASASIKVRWFNQPYISKMFEHVKMVKVTGKATGTKKMYFANPSIEPVSAIPQFFTDSLFDNTQALLPVYPESKGITSRWFYYAIQKVLKSPILDTLEDPIPRAITEKYKLPTLRSALIWIHNPHHKKDSLAARKRFAFDEVFAIQLEKQQRKQQLSTQKALPVQVDKSRIQAFIDTFPYTLTKAQANAIEDIVTDFQKPHPMSRLLEGDVGSGKTAVAAASVYAVATSTPPNRIAGNLQSAYMVPTEILAKQQFASFIEFFKELPINIGLITSSGCQKFPSKTNPNEPTKISKAQLTKWIANGEIAIVVGTHSLIQKSVSFKNLAYVIIDEQHRFGTLQRKTLARKDNFSPHLLSMTATPIPRTLALTIYGDLDLTLLDQMPQGRKAIHTKVVPQKNRAEVYQHIKTLLDEGRQAYVICPRIDEPDPEKASALRMKSVIAEAQRLQKDIFPDKKIAILHGKMKPDEKAKVMKTFEDGDTDILVATSVVEVGVNVPNATVIIIEGAERFGLSQLHQLRGRVRRSNHQPYCYLFTESKSETSKKRLQALEQARDGFELAEYDLKLRGTGELYGTHQWGLTDIGMEAIQNIKMVEAARKEATALIQKDPTLAHYPLLKAFVAQKAQDTHFE